MTGLQFINRDAYDRIGRMHWSKLKLLAKSPAHLRHVMQNGDQFDSDERLLGRVVHLGSFEPEKMASVAVWKGKRAGKEWEAFEKENADAGNEVVTEKQWEAAQAICNAARASRMAEPFLNRGRAEVSMLWTHRVPAQGALPGFEVEMKGRLDFDADAGALVDLKTTSDASPEKFGKQCFNLEYHGQAACYVDGYFAATGTRKPYVIVAVETKPPHVVQVYEIPEDVLELGRELYRARLETFHHCRTHSDWPGYAAGPMQLALPRWAMPDSDDEAGDLGLFSSSAAAS